MRFVMQAVIALRKGEHISVGGQRPARTGPGGRDGHTHKFVPADSLVTEPAGEDGHTLCDLARSAPAPVGRTTTLTRSRAGVQCQGGIRWGPRCPMDPEAADETETEPAPETTEAADDAAASTTFFELVTHDGSMYLPASLAGLKRHLADHPVKGAHIVYRCEAPGASVAGMLRAYNGEKPKRCAIIPTAGEVPLLWKVPGGLWLDDVSVVVVPETYDGPPRDPALILRLTGSRADVRAHVERFADYGAGENQVRIHVLPEDDDDDDG